MHLWRPKSNSLTDLDIEFEISLFLHVLSELVAIFFVQFRCYINKQLDFVMAMHAQLKLHTNTRLKIPTLPKLSGHVEVNIEVSYDTNYLPIDSQM